MRTLVFHGRRLAMSHGIEKLLRLSARRQPSTAPVAAPLPLATPPRHPEDFAPLQHACFQDPYAFYKLLRDDYPVYLLKNGIYCISRYEDIVAISRDTARFSSTHQGVVASLRLGHSVMREAEKLAPLERMGIAPGDVLALSDPPVHSAERKVAHKGLNSRVVKAMEPQVEQLCHELMARFLPSGRVEFMREFAWALPMRLIIRMLGFPEADYDKIKGWCVHGIATQSGIASRRELAISRAEMLVFYRYCWQQFLRAKRAPREDLSGVFVHGVRDGLMDDNTAVSGIMQLLLAGSDSSATSMGNALKLLIENPALQAEIREDIDARLPAFIEEVFRLESAFQGHFRWTREPVSMHGQTLPPDSRIFLMWASGNRDERVFEQPDRIRLDRPNGKKHLTFGHGIHACIGRELARTEIRIVLREFLLRTRELQLDGPAPFMASMFARTLQQLPIRFTAS